MQGNEFYYINPQDRQDILDGRYSIEGTTAILVNPNGDVLVQLRDNKPNIRYPNHWTCPGGVLENGESAEETIRREINEELGIRLGDVQQYGQLLDGYRNLINIFVSHIDTPIEQLQLNEGRELRFISKEAIEELNLTPHARDLLDHYFSHR